jgi:hypothetical protein
MPSIGNIVVKRIIEHKLLPPVLEPIVKGVTLATEQVADIVHHAPLSLLGAGGTTFTHKQSVHSMSQSVVVSDSVTKVKTGGVTGLSYTQTSFTALSYTLIGVAITKGLTENITVGAGTATRLVTKTRSILVSDFEAQEISQTLSIQRGKTRALAETDVISEAVVAVPQTNVRQTLSETNVISESIATFKESKRLQTETVSESGDVSLTLPGIVKTLSETVEISEGVVFEVTHVGGNNVVKTLSETVDITEDTTRQSTLSRAFTETITIGETVTKLITTQITSYTPTSYTELSYMAVIRSSQQLTEIVEESHTVRLMMTKARGITESVTVELSFDSRGDSFDYESFD